MSTDTFSDLETRLRADLPRLADTLMAADVGVDVHADPDHPDSVRALEPLGSRSRRGRWLVPVMAVAAVLLVLLGVVLALRAGDDRDAWPVDVGPAPVESGWAPMATSPLGAREAAVSVWTGTEVIVWGGRVGLMALSDGAAYNPATDTWRMITPNSWAHPGAHAVWTGTEMVVLAKNGGAAYDPASDTWRDLPVVDDANFIAPIWTGSQLIGIGRRGIMPATQLLAIPLAPEGDRWLGPTTVETGVDVADESNDVDVVWTGTEVVVGPFIHQPFAYDPGSNGWRALPPVPTTPVAPPAGVLESPGSLMTFAGSGGDLDVLMSLRGDAGSRVRVGRLGPDGWQWVGPGADVRDSAGSTTTAAPLRVIPKADGEAALLATDTPIRTVDLATGVWSDIDADQVVSSGSNRSVVWSGDDLVVWGGSDGSGQVTANGWRWHPGG